VLRREIWGFAVDTMMAFGTCFSAGGDEAVLKLTAIQDRKQEPDPPLLTYQDSHLVETSTAPVVRTIRASRPAKGGLPRPR
jgi:hypothetical protein